MQDILTSIVISALVRIIWYSISTFEHIVIRYYLIRRRTLTADPVLHTLDRLLFCPRRLSAQTFQIGFVFLLPFVGYCSCPWALPSSCIFGKHGIDSIMEQIVANMGIDVRGSVLIVPNRKLVVSNLKPVLCEKDNAPMKITNAEVANTVAHADLAVSWKVASILCGNGEWRLSSESYFGSSSLDGAISGFWPLAWDSLSFTWARKCIIILSTDLSWP